MTSRITKLLKNLKNRLRQWNQGWRARGKPLLKFTFLLILREIYLFLRNLLGLIFHPYKTLRAIRREEDFSQAILLSSWPFPLWFVLAVFFVVIKFFFYPKGVFNQALNALFIFYSLFFILYSLYLVYWVIFYLKAQRRKGLL